MRRQVVVRAGDVPAGTAAAWFACATSALAARKPFIILLEHVAVDSWTLTGTLGTSDGRVRAFHYDSDPSGGLGIWPRLSLAPCDDPRPRAQGTGLFGLKCANEDEDGKIQMADR